MASLKGKDAEKVLSKILRAKHDLSIIITNVERKEDQEDEGFTLENALHTKTMGRGRDHQHDRCDKDVRSWCDKVTKGFRELGRSGKGSSVFIKKVPKFLKTLNEEAYEPSVVSLGLFHDRISPKLSDIVQYKLDAVHETVTMGYMTDKDIMDKIKGLVPSIIESYEGNFECKQPQLLELAFTLDGCFLLNILNLLNGLSVWFMDPIFREQSTQFDILGDILKLENQIPIIVPVELLAMQKDVPRYKAKKMLLKIICEGLITVASPFSSPLLPKSGPIDQDTRQEAERQAELEEALEKYVEELADYNHVLGFFHDFIVKEGGSTKKKRTGILQNACSCIEIPKHSQEQEQEPHDHRRSLPFPNPLHRLQETNMFHNSSVINLFHQRRPRRFSSYNKLTLRASATELHKKGMIFVSYKGFPSIDSIYFSRRNTSLHLPTVRITGLTEVVFRNLMAVDMCQENDVSVICHYVYLMTNLINGVEDVTLLRKRGVIHHYLTDKFVYDLFNALAIGVYLHVADSDVFADLKYSVNDWYESQTLVKISQFIENHPTLVKYMSIFWAVVLMVAAAVPQAINIVISIVKQFAPQLFPHRKVG